MSDTFKTVITEYLTSKAEDNQEFKTLFENPKKNIDDCLSYIITEVKKTKREGFADQEIFDFAEQYYSKEEVGIDTTLSPTVVVNRPMPKRESKYSTATKPKDPPPNSQLSLF